MGELRYASSYTRQPPSSREDLGDQHVRRLDTNAEDSRNEANHRVRAVLCSRGHRQLAQAFLLDRASSFQSLLQPNLGHLTGHRGDVAPTSVKGVGNCQSISPP
jgi:hypothetical protein